MTEVPIQKVLEPPDWLYMKQKVIKY